MDVLNEVDILFEKLETLPDNVKQIAVKRIAEKLPCFDSNLTPKFDDKRKKPGRKPGRKCVESPEELYQSDSHDSEYVVQSVLTRGGRKAQRYCPNLLRPHSKNFFHDPLPRVVAPISNKLLDVKKDQEDWQSNDGLGVMKSKSHPEGLIETMDEEVVFEMVLPEQNTGDSDTDSNVEDTDSNMKSDSLMEEPELFIVDCAEETLAITEDPLASTEDSPASTEDSPASTEDSPASTEDSPDSNEYSPDSNEYAPDSNEYAPASNEYAPASNENAPASNENAPASNENAPASNENPPASTDRVTAEKFVSAPRAKRKESLEVKEDEDNADPFSHNYACNHCSFITSDKKALQRHLRRHKGSQPQTCEECGKTFTNMSGLKLHLKRHRGQRDYPCIFNCSYRAYTKMDLDRHMTVHTGVKTQMCQYCGKAFAKDSTLREHVKTIHERPEKHICPTCGFCTYRANNLKVHINLRHRGEYNNHVCPVCGIKVKQRSAFLDHMKTHTGERPFRCTICDNTFTCLARLTVHRKAVHEPRRFCCKDCSKRFQTKHHLLRHQVIHTNTKPFSCPFCPYACNTQGNVTKHVKIIHNKPDFSYRKYKSDMQIDEDCKSVKSEWIEKGEKLTQEYLRKFSKRVGRPVTLDELKAQEAEKNKKINEEAKQQKLKRLNKMRKHEHSYHSNKSTAVIEARLHEEEVDEPRAVLLSVTQQPAGTSSNKESNLSQKSVQQVQILPEVTLNHLKEVSQTIYIQNTGTARNLQTIMPSANESSRHQNTSVVSAVPFCVTEPVIYDKQIPVQLIYHTNTRDKNSVGEENDPKFINKINFVEMNGNTSVSPTVVVIINTEKQ